MTFTVEVSSKCEYCSHGDRIVIHGTPWCPTMPAVACCSWQDAQVDERKDGSHPRFAMGPTQRQFSRPVVEGEFVLLVEPYEGDRMAMWGRVEEEDGRWYVREAAHEGPWPWVSYANEDQVGVLPAQGGTPRTPQ